MVKGDVMSAQEKKSRETRRRILAATERLLSEYEFKYLTVRNICAEADVAYGSFYHHFKSKENLLFIYAKELFESNRQANPCPQWIDSDDFIKSILWYFVVFGEYCAAVGKDLIHQVCQAEQTDLFGVTYENVIIPILRNAYRKGYFIQIDGQNVLSDMIKDIRIVYQGVTMWWCLQNEDKEPLAATLEHLILHLIAGRRRQKSDPPESKMLLTDMDYRKDIYLTGIPKYTNAAYVDLRK